MTTARYDPGHFELLPGLGRRQTPWERADVLDELANRVSEQKHADELRVDYYRIGYRLAFPLPLLDYPSKYPGSIDGVPDYPWPLWLSWELNERWRILAAAWTYLGDAEALQALTDELAALAVWKRYNEGGDRDVALVTATLAGCLVRLLTGPDDVREAALPAARRLLETTALPWFDRTWREPSRPLSTTQIQNRPLIALVRSAQLAATLKHDAAVVMNERAVEATETWWSYRRGHGHTEAPAYDGYLLDHVTEWMDTLPGRSELISHGGYDEIVHDWMHLTLPGRPDLLAPLSDVEPQMPYWATAAIRIAGWHADRAAADFVRRYPLARLSAAGLAAALDFPAPAGEPGAAGWRRAPSSVSMRTGWTDDDALVAVGVSRGSMDHLHHDGGHVVIGWRGRSWITDPGYQQYRTGLEREYTLGPMAHNCPVIDGQQQTNRAAEVVSLDDEHVELDLTGCYPNLGSDASVRRDVQLVGDGRRGRHRLVVRDRFSGLHVGATVAYHWLGGTDMAWSFVAGWARLSCSAGALWVGRSNGVLKPDHLVRHPGTRGPLTLQITEHLATGAGECQTVVVTDPDATWRPPDDLSRSPTGWIG